MSTPFITATDISIRVGSTFLFDRDSWTMYRGQQWAIVGANGAGKSTLVKALAGRLSLRSGQIRLYFGDPHRPPYPISQQNHIAYVSFESHKRVIVREQKQADMASYIGKAYQTPRSVLSTGQLRKILLEEALQKNPALLILDEPFEGLDKANRKVLIKYIKDLVKAGVHLILVTHHPDEIIEPITHVMVVENGCIAKTGVKSEITSFHLYTVSPASARSDKSSKLFIRPQKRQEIVAFQNVTVRYGRVTALSRVSWSMCEGENWAVLGTNGSGKSTLARLIVADEPQAYGQEIRIFGKQKGSGESIWDIKREIGYISTDLHIAHTEPTKAFKVILSGLYDSIGFYRILQAEDMQKLKKCSIRLGVEDLVERDFLSLSTGEQRLILLARALIKSPRLIVADEPLHGLDRKNRAMCLQVFERVVSDGTQLLYITHRTDEIIPSIHKILLLQNGKVAACGTRSEILDIST